MNMKEYGFFSIMCQLQWTVVEMQCSCMSTMSLFAAVKPRKVWWHLHEISTVKVFINHIYSYITLD